MASLYNYDLMHHHHQQMPQTVSQYPQFTHTEWLQGWRRWAESRKRGKMAQFIVELLEKGASGHWLDITIGKFELTEWHAIAQFWYKKKKRASDPTDAPCMLRKGLPRAFPNLREVKSDSVKDGTQYKSRVFQCPPELVQEVIQIMSGQGSYQLIHNPLATAGDSTDEEDQPTEGWPDEVNDMSDLSMMLQPQNGYSVSPQLPHSDHMFDSQIKKEQQMWGNSFVSSPASFGASPSHSPQYPITDVNQQQPINGHEVIMPHEQWGGLQTQQSQPMGGDVNNLYNPHLTDGTNTLEVPAPLTPAADSRRSSGGSLGRNSTLQASYPNSPQRSSPQMIPATSQMISHAQMISSSITHMEQPQEPALMPIKLVPNKSPLEGGGELAVMFAQGFPDGQKTVLYVSHQNPSYSYRVDALQENPMTLSVIIPSHPIAEEVDLQVFCNNRLIARAPFTFYQGANYEVAQMLQFINQYMPQFFTPGFNPSMLGNNSSGSQEGFSQGNGNYNYGNPAYMLLVGACKSGIEPLVRALLQIPGVGPLLAAPIPGHKGLNVAELAKQNGHIAISKCIKDLINYSVVTARLPSGDDPIEKLEKGGNTPQQSAKCVLHALKAVRDGKDPASAIKDFVNSSSSKPTNGAVDTENEITRLSRDISTIVVSEEAATPSDGDTAATPDASITSAKLAELETLKEENEKLKEIVEMMKEQNQIKVRECKLLTQERDRLSIKIADLEGELEDTAPMDHVGQLGRAQSDMTIMPKVFTSRGGGLNLTNKPRLTRQNRSIDPNKNPPLALTQTWLSKESGISLSMEEESSGRRRSSLLSLMSERGEGNEITLLYPNDEARTVGESLYFDTMHIITEDWPLTENAKMFKAGERLVEIDGQQLRDKTFDEVLELLKQTNPDEDGKKKIVKQTMPPILASIASDIDLDASKIDSLLSHTPPNARQVTLSRASDDLPFKLAGGNAVGLFITEAPPDSRILPGDQIMQINGRSTANMTYEEAMVELKSSTQFNLEVLHNHQAWESQRLQRRFELDSVVYKCCSSYSPDKENTAMIKDSLKEMELTPGTMVHVINTSLYEESGYWLAWKLSPEGHKVALKKIPSALKAKELYGDVGKLYERVNLPVCSQ